VSYREAAAYLEALGVDGMTARRPSRHRIEALCEALDNPERSVTAIHVTGTNGKTSTARIAAGLLGAAGLKVGTFSSPHLQSVRERVMLGDEPLPEEAFGDVFDHIRPYIELVEDRLGERITYFEVLTAMFFVWAAENVDAAVIEVGLGGTWDATNVVTAPVSVITHVGLDHTAILGSEPEIIATEKVGIIKPESIVVTAERAPSVLSIIEDAAAGVKASTSVIERDFKVRDNRIAFGGRYLSVSTSQADYEGLFVPLHGRHQGVNAATALEAVGRFLPANPLSPDVVAQGLANVRIPGRLEVFRIEDVDAPVVLDVAHNPEGISALVSSLAEAFAFDTVRFVVGILGAKDYSGMLAEIARLPCSVVLTRPRGMRAAPLDDLERVAKSLQITHVVCEDVAAGMNAAIESSETGDLVCVTGSHYVVGEARAELVTSRGAGEVLSD
jgi:dihydrofolate synthase / folylpolyglutamate synthase